MSVGRKPINRADLLPLIGQEGVTLCGDGTYDTVSRVRVMDVGEKFVWYVKPSGPAMGPASFMPLANLTAATWQETTLHELRAS